MGQDVNKEVGHENLSGTEVGRIFPGQTKSCNRFSRIVESDLETVETEKDAASSSGTMGSLSILFWLSLRSCLPVVPEIFYVYPHHMQQM